MTPNNIEGEVVYTADTPVHVVSRLHAELVCFEAGMDMNKLAWLRYMNEFHDPEWDAGTKVGAGV